jgi:polysaccharide deacetylase 2 family uncharacterized protein YibQ
LGTDLHAPLGQNRPAAKRRARRFSAISAFGFFVVLCVLGLSIYGMGGDEALKQVATTTPPNQQAVPSPPTNAEEAAAPASSAMPRSNPNSGANIERTLTEDGSVVTKYTPRPRDGGGPVLLDAQRIGQDPRVAAQPNEMLLEETPHGRLPIVGPDGLRPMDQYARPWSGARGTRIAIVVGGLGLSQTGTQRAIQQLPAGVTFAFAASGNSLQRWMQEARRSGHEILIQVPFEPFDYPVTDPGTGTLLTKTSAKQNLERLHEAMGKITNYTGIMNYLGGRYLADTEALEPILRDISKRGLLFLDDGTSAQSKTAVIAKAIDLPHAFGDLTLDGQLQADAILKKLDELERIAARNGKAVGIASAFDESIDAIRKWSEEASRRGIEIVGVSTLASESVAP